MYVLTTISFTKIYEHTSNL